MPAGTSWARRVTRGGPVLTEKTGTTVEGKAIALRKARTVTVRFTKAEKKKKAVKTSPV